MKTDTIMHLFKATLCRIEHKIIKAECFALDEEDAERQFETMLEEDDFEDAECVHAEEFIQDIQQRMHAI